MTHNDPSEREYFAAHAGRINHLINLVDFALKDDVVAVELHPNDPVVDRSPEQLSEVANSELMFIADAAFRELQARATLAEVLKIADEKEAEGWQEDQVVSHVERIRPGLMDYRSGEYLMRLMSMEDDRALKLVRVRIKGLQEYGEATKYEITASDSDIDQSLAITLIGQEVDDVAVKVRPSTNHLIEEAVTIMGLRAHKLITILTGQFEDEKELDQIIDNILKEYEGTPYESELEHLLGDVRTQALSQKQFSSMRHNLTKPTQDDFEGFISLIDAPS